ncbi:MAG TPA: hypothetical protein VER83_05430 [Candidatus Nanopelagicales bacterium]|nr:hypothetical protein [Candidatus Nanopelagicales bacterium]
MPDPLDDILRLVGEGRLSPAEAAPIIDALAAAQGSADRARAGGQAARDATQGVRGARPTAPPGPPRRLRVQVRDGGRTVVDLQLPGVLAELAGAVPGIPAAYADRVREALRTGLRGPIVDVVDEDGSGVTISID